MDHEQTMGVNSRVLDQNSKTSLAVFCCSGAWNCKVTPSIWTEATTIVNCVDVEMQREEQRQRRDEEKRRYLDDPPPPPAPVSAAAPYHLPPQPPAPVAGPHHSPGSGPTHHLATASSQHTQPAYHMNTAATEQPRWAAQVLCSVIVVLATLPHLHFNPFSSDIYNIWAMMFVWR